MAALVERWSDAGAAVPVAIVVSVFDDVLPAVADDGHADLDAIVVDDTGVACLREPCGLASASRLLVRALGDEVPSNARPFVTRLIDGDGPIDAEQLRQWMRDALGAPASREEVRAAFAVLDESEADTLLPAPAAVEDEELETLPPAQSSSLPVPDLVSESDEEMRAIAGEAPLPPERPHDTLIEGPPSFAKDAEHESVEPEAAVASEAPSTVPVSEAPASDAPSVVGDAYASPPANAEGADAEGADPSTIVAPTPQTPIADSASDSDGRKIVRHTYNPKTVSLHTAPAARRSARAAAIGPDSILVPNDRRRGYGWMAVLAAVGAAVYFLFFR